MCRKDIPKMLLDVEQVIEDDAAHGKAVFITKYTVGANRHEQPWCRGRPCRCGEHAEKVALGDWQHPMQALRSKTVSRSRDKPKKP